MMADETARREQLSRELLRESERAYRHARAVWRLDRSPSASALHLRRSIQLLGAALAETENDVSVRSREDELARAVERGLLTEEVAGAGPFLDALATRFEDIPPAEHDEQQVLRYERLLAAIPLAQRNVETHLPTTAGPRASADRAAKVYLWVSSSLVVLGLGWILVRPEGSWRGIPTAAPAAPSPSPPPPPRASPDLPPAPAERVSNLEFPSKSTPNLQAPADGLAHRFVLSGDEGEYDLRLVIHGTRCAMPGAPPDAPRYAAFTLSLNGKPLQSLQPESDQSREYLLRKIALDEGFALDLTMSGDLVVDNECDRNLWLDALDIVPAGG